MTTMHERGAAKAGFSLFCGPSNAGPPTVFLLTPDNLEADGFLRALVSGEATWLGRSLAVEHRYIADLVNGLGDAGWGVH